MKGTLKLAHVRSLVRLYRADIEGAGEQLEKLLRERWDELPPLLGSNLQQLTRLLEHEDAARAFAGAIEQAPAASTASRSLPCRTAARAAALALAKATVIRDSNHHQLPIAALRAALELGRGNGDIAFGDRGAVDIARLRAVVRHCAGLDSVTVTLTHDQLILRYSTPRARGVIRLVLRDPGKHDKVLVVPIASRNMCVASPSVAIKAVYAPAPWPADDAQRAASPQPPMPPMRPVLVLVR